MNACVLHGIGDLRYENAPEPELGPEEVLLRVVACGVCGSDIPRVFTKGTYTFPTIPGHELAGIVVDAGEGNDPALMGGKFAVFPLIPCRECKMCDAHEFALCENYDYIGSRCNGGFAEYVRVPVWNLAPVPEGVSLDEAAMTEPCAVALHALRQGGITPGDKVAIFGAGPIGLMLAQWARAEGAEEVLLIDIDPAKLAFASELGFDWTCNARKDDAPNWVRENTGGGADLVIEGSGSSIALGQCFQAAKPLGRVVLMGNPSGDMNLSQQDYWAALRKQLRITGTWNSVYGVEGRDEWLRALDAMAKKELDLRPLITHRVDLAGLPAMLERIRDQAEFTNKVLAVCS